MATSTPARLRSLIASSVLLTALALLAPARSHATFPGPNGQIAFHSDRSIFTVAPGGGKPRKLPEDVPGFGGLAISADGTKIVYDDSHTLYLMNADGTEVQTLTTPGGPESDNPTFSPDGKHIAFERDYGIWVMDVDGSHAHTITPGATFAGADYDPAWSPDGRRIAYTSEQQVWAMNADGSGATSLTPPVPMCPKSTRTMSGEEPEWSPDGRRIVFTGPVDCANWRGTDIWEMNADGSGQVDLIGDDSTDDADPLFSPDGSTIAFTRRDSADAKRLMMMPASGGSPYPVDVTSAEVEGPAWGRKLTKEHLSLKVKGGNIRTGGQVPISGAVKPLKVGAVKVTIARDGRQVATKRVRLSHGRFQLTYRAAKPGNYRVVATLPDGDGHLEATSNARKFTVRAHG